MATATAAAEPPTARPRLARLRFWLKSSKRARKVRLLSAAIAEARMPSRSSGATRFRAGSAFASRWSSSSLFVIYGLCLHPPKCV